MYLLMLLATFMSAIYGYNLSARPDYDRDVPRKKAASIILKFKHQHLVAASVFETILSRGGSDGKGTCQTSDTSNTTGYCSADGGHLQWALPDDMIYSTDNAAKFEMEYKQGNITEKTLYVRRTSHAEGDPEINADILQYGFTLNGTDEMISRLVCINGELYDGTAATCEAMTTAEGYTSGSCCNTATHRYVVSYMKIDSRWLNKLTQAINLDFRDALQNSKFKDNTGAIIKYHDAAAESFWLFTGRIYFYPVYAQDLEAFLADQEAQKKAAEEEGKDPETTVTGKYSNELMRRTSWALPKFFGINFFMDKGGNYGSAHFCDNGCLFRINEI
jgi:hypothetical protein